MKTIRSITLSLFFLLLYTAYAPGQTPTFRIDNLYYCPDMPCPVLVKIHAKQLINCTSFTLNVTDPDYGITLLGFETYDALNSGSLNVMGDGNSVTIQWGYGVINVPDSAPLIGIFIYCQNVGFLNLSGNLPVNYINGNIILDSCSTIQGTLTYDNDSLTPIPNTPVTISKTSSTALFPQVFGNQVTSSNGHYVFNNLPPGDYSIRPNCNLPYGGLNSNDMLLGLHAFVGLATLSPLRSVASDVNGNGLPNMVDVLTMMRRFTGQISSYLPPDVSSPGKPDWLFEPNMIPVHGNGLFNSTVKMICTGDLNGSYIP